MASLVEKSILKTVRKSVTGSIENNFFDQDLIMGINAGFLTLTQLGLGPEEGFAIEDDTAEWEDFTDDELLLNTVNTYICRRTKMEFDPPSNSTYSESLRRSIDELEWRLRHAQEFHVDKEG